VRFKVCVCVCMCLKILAVDSTVIAGLKERYDSCDQLLGSSPLLMLSMSSKPQKPLSMTVTNPSGGSKKPKSEPSKAAGATSLPRTGWRGQGAICDITVLDSQALREVIGLVVTVAVDTATHGLNHSVLVIYAVLKLHR